ncbi:carbon-nitrogen family hydrolase [Kytococcus sedentarius]|uniref:Predicted amidohydrolase n=1 Tax=Kytococcus sedentarius (strain ATCC 14392 / DSM 20547 / JCM 11482 / CCUG 33030 / NBRC 15357 / NCTC 11040 / CCM 314 / 541) TaxID=478801 RepID=C7NGT1_KYTSD|nr:carbon-nitrogen family hydrolase [Kytococcus sedentarius]ACV07603.1 predicted amidohydrolase [Kytococcus sedentarius DSM 20547]QQB63531.1 carbon-nitrogen family hydrolase [Kytococcus sedentarius]STX13545.1 Aliphatic amidase [Kytococcus sedentarius]
MSELSVSVIQVSYGDDEPMADRIQRVADLVRAEQGQDLVVLPELWPVGGFDVKHWDERAQIVPAPGPVEATGDPERAVVEALSAAAREAGVTLHGGSTVERSAEPGPEGKHLWNSSMLFAPTGDLVATYRKVYRFGFDSGEARTIEAGADLVTAPVGPFTAHLATCFDLRFPEYFRDGLDAGADLLIVPAAWPMARREHWRALLRARAIENQMPVVACNTAGTHAGDHEMGGASVIIDANGSVLAEAGDSQQVLRAVIDDEHTAQQRKNFPVLASRR